MASSERIPELDGLRGVAISLVLFFHYFVQHVNPHGVLSYVLASANLSWSGVDLFFVLSGFLIGGILLDARQSSNYFRVFYVRRFFRIIPIYAVLLVASGLLFSSGHLHIVTGSRLPSLPFVLFLQNFWMARHGIFGAAPQAATWSLAVEEQFYLALPTIVRFSSRRTLAALAVLSIGLAPLFRFAMQVAHPRNQVAPSVLLPGAADSLLLGVLAAMALRNPKCAEWLKGHKTLLRTALVVLFAGLALITRTADLFDAPGAKGALFFTLCLSWIALFYACVLVYALTHRASLLGRCLRWAWLGWIGSISYGVYLFHLPVLFALHELVRNDRPEIHSLGNLGLTVAAIGLTLVMARASWIYFEKPLIRIGHKWRYHTGSDSKPGEVADAGPATQTS